MEKVQKGVTRMDEKRSAAKAVKSAEVELKASDGKRVVADLYTTAGRSSVILLLFHQARSSAAEYAPIAPRLVAEGYDCLATDQRSGGDMYEPANRVGSPGAPYMAAYPDMLGALAWAKAKDYKTIVAWGSSYSASLAMKLATQHAEVDAVLAFSPGEYFDALTTVKNWNMKVQVPTFMAMTPEEGEEGGLLLYEASSHSEARKHSDMFVSFPDGVHGSSTLREDKNPKSYKKYFQAAISFLKANASP
ncbi:MAG: alpha/beta hydrolase [Fimbriimonadales bacterium]